MLHKIPPVSPLPALLPCFIIQLYSASLPVSFLLPACEALHLILSLSPVPSPHPNSDSTGKRSRNWAGQEQIPQTGKRDWGLGWKHFGGWVRGEKKGRNAHTNQSYFHYMHFLQQTCITYSGTKK